MLLEIKNLMLSERNVGMLSRPSFTAAQDEPQKKQIIKKPE
jgi:hypothetical protein